MSKWARIDKEGTQGAGFLDKRSWIGFNSKDERYVRLFGKDMMALREKVFDRENWICYEYLKAPFGKGPSCSGGLELSHDIPRGRGGSDTPENTHCRCRKHHRILDNMQVKLRSVK